MFGIYGDFTASSSIAAPKRLAADAARPDTLPNGKKDWSRFNATVVGAVWDTSRRPSYYPGLPGIDSSKRTPYRPLSAAAKREYGPDEGWIHVGRRGRTWRPRYVDREPVQEQ